MRGAGALLAVAVAGWAAAAGARQPASPRGPELLGAGVISTAAPEFSSTLSADGREIYFARASADRARVTLMTATLTASGAWTTPIAAPFATAARDLDPFLTPDGRRLYFTSDRARQGRAAGPLATWYVERTTNGPGGWGPPIDPGAPLNSEAGDVFMSAARDGSLMFTSMRAGGPPRVYTSRSAGGTWTAPELVTLPEAPDAGNPALAPSGRFVVFTLAPAGGAPDLFVSCRSGGAWTRPRPLTAVNSPAADFAPFVSADERTLYFTSERPGLVPAPADGSRPPGDLYRIALTDAGVHCP